MTGKTDRRIQRIWSRYKRRRSQVLRHALIEHYQPLLRIHARRLRARLTDCVDIEELSSAGTFGLMAAVEAFDPDRGIKFETFSGLHIHGAMIDELRRLDWVPRLVRRRARKVADITGQFNAEQGRAPTWDELASRLGMSRANFERVARDSRPATLYSLSPAGRGRHEEGEVNLGPLIDRHAINPVHQAQHKAVKEWVTRGLVPAERLIIILYYYEEMTMEQIGKTLGMSESRVSQLHKLILDRFRSRLNDSHFRAEVLVDAE